MHLFSMTRPDDWHVHLRDQDALQHTVPAISKHFARALIMPNLNPALTSVDSLIAYRERILQHIPTSMNFLPFMTLYLNNNVTPKVLHSLKKHSFILGAKLYPAGATFNSAEGAHSIRSLYPLFESMQEHDLVLQIHGEITHGDIFEREMRFLNETLTPLMQHFPQLRIVLEHISTAEAVKFILQAPHNIAATITPHHLAYNRNHLLAGGIRPHYYCLPILKHEKDQHALQQAAISGNPRFFAGTDSAPHAQQNKEQACGCAGIYSSPYALALYATIFDQLNNLQFLEGFMSHNGADFYHLPRSNDSIQLIKKLQTIPEKLPFGNHTVIPIAAGTTLPWSIYEP